MRGRSCSKHGALLVFVTGTVVAAWMASGARAQAETTPDAHAAVRCRKTTAIALAGRLPLAAESALQDDQAFRTAVMNSDDFRDRFASYLMRELNNAPAEDRFQDALYTMTVDVLKERRPFSDLFKGKLTIKLSPTTARYYVTDDPDGLGYFRTSGWMVRYAGNEGEGIRLTTAYRVMHNLTGMKLTAVNNAEAGDVSKKGRESPHCRGCHYDGWAPLDPIAALFGKRRGIGASIEFLPPDPGVSATVAGHVVKSDRELVELLVASNDYKVRMCRLMFKFVYGRDETSCEAPVFDRCVDVLNAEDSAVKALDTLVSQGGFCS